MILNLFLAISSTLWMLVVYFIKETSCIKFEKVQEFVGGICSDVEFTETSFLIFKYIIWMFSLLLPVVISYFSIRWIYQLDTDEINGKCLSIEEANNSFTSAYLGYFFVSLSVPNGEVMSIVYFILLVFTLASQTQYYNPAFLILGYRFYYVVTSNNVKIFVITKRNIRSTTDLKFCAFRRINNSSYFEVEGG